MDFGSFFVVFWWILVWFVGYSFCPIFDVVLYRFWKRCKGPQPWFLQYTPCENKVFRIGVSLTNEVNITKRVARNTANIHQKIINNRLKNQSKNKSDFGAENGGNIAPKMRPGTARKRQKTRQTWSAHNVEKKCMRATQGPARSATDLSWGWGFAPNLEGILPKNNIKP